MISDLFISMTMLRIELSHAHQRLITSQKYFSSNNLTNIKPTSSNALIEIKPVESKPLDLINLEVRRANLIFSEHRSTQRKTSETKQILNCSLRQIFFKFETFGELSDATQNLIPTTSNLLIDLGEIELDLPMNAQSIHELAIKHSPQLNEQVILF